MEEFADENEWSSTIRDDNIQSTVFAELKPLCSDILQFLQNPQKDCSSLTVMTDYIRRAPVAGLQASLDFTMFPLLLLLDAAIRCRSQQKFDPKGMMNSPFVINDRVVEGVLLCFEELLKRCHLGSVDLMVVVLKKLTSGALLSPSEAAEEFREGIIKCFRALLLGLHPCSIESCSCKDIAGLPFFTLNTSLPVQIITRRLYSEPEECLLAFLRSQNASAAVGHWLSLLLQAAETEAGRGHHGSARLRIEAFLTLRVVVAKVGTADALAFFLPGVVSQFAKVLHISKTMISGAAGSVESIEHAVKGLAEFLMIVFGDEANLHGLSMSADDLSGICSSKDGSAQSILDALRCLPVKTQDHDGVRTVNGNSIDMAISTVSSKFDPKDKSTSFVHEMAPLYVDRTKDWIDKTSERVDKLLTATFPHLCVHSSQKVRLALVDSIRGLLTKCTCTLWKSKLTLLECLLVLVSDDVEVVSVTAQECLEYLFMFGEEHIKENEISDIFNSLINKLPTAVLGSEEKAAVSHAQGLLAAMYYAGPRRVVEHLLRSPLMAARFVDFLALSLSHNSAFSGSVGNLSLAKPSSFGYLHSIAELKAITCLSSSHYDMANNDPTTVHRNFGSQDMYLQDSKKLYGEHDLPRMPPWFVHVGGQKLYLALAGILRLLGLSTMADCRSEVSLSILTDIPLEHIQKLISEIRMKEYNKESWKSWYSRTGSGQLLRQACSAVCVINEIIYGISDLSVDLYTNLFRNSKMKVKELEVNEVEAAADQHDDLGTAVLRKSVWKVCLGREARQHVIDCVRSILHEYLSPEVWDLPLDHNSYLLVHDPNREDLGLHFFQDISMLHQVIIDGLGIFSLALGKDFQNSGFLHASLYLLLESLICSSFQIKSASDAVLHILSTSSGYTTVRQLVVANADYIIDSLCRQLRHLDLNPHVPNVLAAMLSCIGVAHDILPLLEEPMRAVSMELEVLGRHQHPNLTIPFLKAVREISKASRHEAYALPNEAQSYNTHVKSCVESVERIAGKNGIQAAVDGDDACLLASDHWEQILFKLEELRRYRRSVGSVAVSCLTAAIPLLASTKEAACLVALDIIEDGISALAKVEEAYKHEKESKEEILHVVQLCLFHDLQDTLDATDEIDENRLLPAMNKIWPYLVLCLQHKNQAVIRRCLNAVSIVVQICGGDFFIRRFHADGSIFWKLLSNSPFRRKSTLKNEKPLLLPYRNTSPSPSDSMAEVTSQRTQEAALNMIAEISRNKQSAAALGGAVFNKVSGLVVGMACSSSVASLNGACINALSGLATIDPDFIWLLLADVVYTLGKTIPSPPTLELAEVSQLLPPPLSAKEFLFMQYGGDVNFDVDISLTEKVFRKLLSEVCTSQMYN